MKKILLISLCCLCYFISNAQTVVWQMAPSNFTSIQRLNKNLFKVTRNNKIGLINADGTIVADPIFDHIGDFYEEKALMTINDGHGERVAGYLTKDGRFTPYHDKYYTLTGQDFFSEDLLSVSDENGRIGYIDKSGNKVLGFDGMYDRIKPFCEGFAAVHKNKKYYLIDKDGNRVHFQFNGIGEVYGGTNVYKGKAYVWDGSNKLYTFDVQRPNATCKPYGKLNQKSSFDYLFRFSYITNVSKNVPYEKFEYQGNHGLKPTLTDGRYGFFKGDTSVFPSQLSSATEFIDGLSIVELDGGIGILRFVEDEGFSVSVPNNEYTFYAGKTIKCDFTINIPSVWRGKELSVVLKNLNGTSIQTSNIVNSYSFDVRPSGSSSQEYRLAVYAERLKLFESNLNYTFIRLCETCHKDYSICHGRHVEDTPKERDCPTCHLPISKCSKNGVH